MKKGLSCAGVCIGIARAMFHGLAKEAQCMKEDLAVEWAWLQARLGGRGSLHQGVGGHLKWQRWWGGDRWRGFKRSEQPAALLMLLQTNIPVSAVSNPELCKVIMQLD